jgi:hypothetical protein
MELRAGQQIVVATPDRREYRGRLVRLQTDVHGRTVAVVRLDTGWETHIPSI